MKIPTLTDVRMAADRIRPYIHHTPVLSSRLVDEWLNASVFFKCENFQHVGAFKMRGAGNVVFSLSNEDAQKGVATHSSGNHAQALALAARLRGIPAWIVMPENAPEVKRNAVKGYGAEIRFCKPTLQAREETLEEVVRETGAHFVPPYDDPRVIAGQGTAALELLEQQPDLDIVMAPVGGGGLMCGTAITVRSLHRDINVYGAEPAGADDAWQSYHSGKLIPQTNPDTIADGLRTSLSDLTFEIIHTHLDDLLRVSEPGIVEAMRFIWERMKIIIEPSAAVPVAAMREYPDLFNGKRVGIILSGGNVDLNHLPWQ
ncbi:MAG TPA: pyridoxal-phosphate dependent enzyme [Balneolales bacterium]|nr:pyridoxal-phosphate dependent enzyme [Balneolales bacterium]